IPRKGSAYKTFFGMQSNRQRDKTQLSASMGVLSQVTLDSRAKCKKSSASAAALQLSILSFPCGKSTVKLDMKKIPHVTGAAGDEGRKDSRNHASGCPDWPARRF